LTWLIIIVVLLAAFGPILWLVPSRKDRRLMQVRQAARQEGLTVELDRVPLTNPTAAQRVSAGGVLRDPQLECGRYSYPLPGRLQHLPQWRLLKQAGAEDGPRPGWVFNPHLASSTPHLQQMLAAAEALFNQLPEDVVGIEVRSRDVSVFWLEGAGSGAAEVARIAAALRDSQAQFTALEAAIEAALRDEDS
jgi:hypothetical protein